MDPEEEIKALKAALRELRWQNYHLFNVQRQRAYHANQREKDLVREMRQHIKALQRAKKLVGELRESIARLAGSVTGLLSRKRIRQMERTLAKCEAEWEPRVPEQSIDPAEVAHPEDDDEALRIPFLTPTIDIVVCVHNALDDVKRCLDSIEKRSPKLQRIVLVNDGSDEATSAYLKEFTEETVFPTEIIHNLEARGYTVAANQGLRRSYADYTVLLNSDTIVTHHWLESIVACGERDPDIGIIGTLSNAASWQSVPERFAEGGDWEVNELPEGITPDDAASRLLLEHDPSYPEVPLVNGFCFVIRRNVFNQIGYLDEETFPRGYGEENDYCLRAAKAGLKLAITDNAYIFHAKSKSFTHQKRRELSKNATKLLHDKHGQATLDQACEQLKEDPGLEKARDAFAKLQNAKVPFRILFIMDFKGEGGGTHSIVQETGGLCDLGVFAQMAIRDEHADFYEAHYPNCSSRRFYRYQSDYELTAYAGTFDVVVATLFTSVGLLKQVKTLNPDVVPAYYIQDYEPMFYDENDPLHHQARMSYHMVPDAVCFAKTKWICDTLKEKENIKVHQVTPSIDHQVYHPDNDRQETPLVVAAMVRPSTPRRSPELTMDILRKVKKEFGEKLKVVVFGGDPSLEFWKEVDTDWEFDNQGVLTRERVSGVLQNAHLFLDLSTYQAFGRTGLEAMACGCIPVVPSEGGSGEYTRDGENGYIVDTSDREVILTKVREFLNLVDDKRLALRKAALETAKDYTVKAAAESEKKLFESILTSQIHE